MEIPEEELEMSLWTKYRLEMENAPRFKNCLRQFLNRQFLNRPFLRTRTSFPSHKLYIWLFLEEPFVSPAAACLSLLMLVGILGVESIAGRTVNVSW